MNLTGAREYFSPNIHFWFHHAAETAPYSIFISPWNLIGHYKSVINFLKIYDCYSVLTLYCESLYVYVFLYAYFIYIYICI